MGRNNWVGLIASDWPRSGHYVLGRRKGDDANRLPSVSYESVAFRNKCKLYPTHVVCEYLAKVFYPKMCHCVINSVQYIVIPIIRLV